MREWGKGHVRQRLEYNRRKPVVERILAERAKSESDALDRVARGASEEAWRAMMNEWGREGE